MVQRTFLATMISLAALSSWSIVGCASKNGGNRADSTVCRTDDACATGYRCIAHACVEPTESDKVDALDATVERDLADAASAAVDVNDAAEVLVPNINGSFIMGFKIDHQFPTQFAVQTTLDTSVTPYTVTMILQPLCAILYRCGDSKKPIGDPFTATGTVDPVTLRLQATIEDGYVHPWANHIGAEFLLNVTMDGAIENDSIYCGALSGTYWAGAPDEYMSPESTFGAYRGETFSNGQCPRGPLPTPDAGVPNLPDAAPLPDARVKPQDPEVICLNHCSYLTGCWPERHTETREECTAECVARACTAEHYESVWDCGQISSGCLSYGDCLGRFLEGQCVQR